MLGILYAYSASLSLVRRCATARLVWLTRRRSAGVRLYRARLEHGRARADGAQAHPHRGLAPAHAVQAGRRLLHHLLRLEPHPHGASPVPGAHTSTDDHLPPQVFTFMSLSRKFGALPPFLVRCADGRLVSQR
jgi:hypothetical protein